MKPNYHNRDDTLRDRIRAIPGGVDFINECNRVFGNIGRPLLEWQESKRVYPPAVRTPYSGCYWRKK